MKHVLRTSPAFLLSALLVAAVLVGCTPRDSAEPPPESNGSTEPAPLKIGTLATQDSLPLWVAEEAGYFEQVGLSSVEIVTFQSAQECQAAFSAGAVDALMTDIIVAANLHVSGTPVVIPTVMLGATIPEGRFAVVGAPGTSFGSMADLKGVPVGSASPTITEYVLDQLMDEAGVAAADVKKEEVKKMPVRFQLLMEGQLKAASLPEPFVTLAEQQGAYIVPGGDDTKAAENISQTVLAVRREFTETDAGAAAAKALLEAWNLAVADINASPDDFRQTLVEKAGLPEPLAKDYQVSEYPTAGPPAAADVQRVLDWMSDRGYLKTPLSPEELLSK